MKKILGTIALVALLSSVAFADVNVSASTYINEDVMDLKINPNASSGKVSAKFFDQSASQFDSLIGVSASGENVGVVAQVGVDMAKGTPNIGVNNWYGWFKASGFKLTAGNFVSRYTGGLKNASEVSLLKGAGAYGVYSISDVANDADQFTADSSGSSRKRFAVVGDYTVPFGDMLVLLKGGLTGIWGNTPPFSHKSATLGAGYAFQAVYQMPLLILDALVRVPETDKVSTAVYVTVKPIKAMGLVVGAAVGFEDRQTFAWGIDARLRTQLSDAMALTVQGNISDKDKGIYNSGRDKATKKADNTWTGYAIVGWDMNVNDMFNIFAEAGYDKTAKTAKGEVSAQFGTVIKPVSNASVHLALRGYGDIAAKTLGFKIPVVLSYAF